LGKKSSPPPPDYSGVANASEKAAELSYQAAQDQLAWSREQWAEQKTLLDEIMDTQLPMMKEQYETAKADRARYEELYQPMEQEYLQRAQEWDTPERRNEQAAKATSEVAQQAEAQRQNALRRLEGYGVDPSQTRSQALDLGARMQQAKAQAGAATGARDAVEREGMGMLGESINVGRGMASQGLNYAASGNQLAAQTAQNAGAWQNAGQAMGGPTDWMNMGNKAVGNWGNTLTNMYSTQMDGYAAGQQGKSGMMSAIGTIGGAALGGPMGASLGGALFSAEGGEISGPGGPKDDAIPAQLSDGEYVIPEEVVRRKGTEFFDKLISKTKEDLAAKEDMAQVTRQGMAIPPDMPMPQAQGMACGGEARKR
jgi:hypothetical protein